MIRQAMEIATRSRRTGSPARVSAVAVAAALGLLSSMADAQELRFTTTAPGGIVATGNTLGLAKAADVNAPGVEHSIGTFISLDPTSVDDLPNAGSSSWPAGTTWDWTENGSTGELQLPSGAEVLHAELVWAGSYDYWPENVTTHLDDPVTLFAGSEQVSVSPDPQTALTLSEQSYTGFWANYYLRSADVTSFVATHGSATYAVSGVAATQGDLTNTLSAAGWSLVVAYRASDEPIRNLSIFVGGSFVDEDSEQDYTVSGFCAPPYGVVEGDVVISALEGDANLTGDDLAIGKTAQGSFVSLMGPNNPESNFFCSQVNGADGLVDRSGSFGDDNHDPHAGVNVAGARQGWDLTTVGLTSVRDHLANDQKSAVLRTTTTGDSYMPVLVAIELDVKSPDFSDSLTEASEDLVQVGDEFSVTTTLKNSGEAQATDMVMTLPLDNGLELLSFSMDGQPGDASGAQVTAADLTTGIDAGDLAVEELRTVELHVRVVGPPDNGSQFVFAPEWGHSFTMCTGDAPIVEAYAGPTDTVDYFGDDGGLGGGGQGGGTGQGGSAAGPLANDPGEMGGCQCAAVGGNGPVGAGAGLLGLIMLAAAAGARRRRS